MKPPAYSLSHIMTELLNMGMPFEKILPCVTATPAKQIGMASDGFLLPSAPADVAVFRQEERHFHLKDRYGNEQEANQILRPMLTIRNGIVLYRQCDFFNL